MSSLKEKAFDFLRAADKAVSQLHFDIGHDYKDTVIVAGSARGGTTWLAEILNFDNSYRFIFEPISHYEDASRKEATSRKKLLWGLYIRSEDDNPAFVEPVEKIVSGRFRSGYSDRFNRQPFPRRRLVKDVGINLLLHWLHTHFPEIPIIQVLRHPCAVIHSRLRIGWDHRKLDNFLRQDALVADYLAPFQADIRAASPFEQHVMHWCIETLVPLKKFKPGEHYLAFYENFRLRPRQEIAALFAHLGRPCDERVFHRLDRPSKRTKLGRSRELTPTARHDDWRKYFSDNERRSAQDILQLFGLGSLYRADGMPAEQPEAALSTVT